MRKHFRVRNLLQVLIGVVFGYFTTFCNYLVSFLPTPEHIFIRIVMALISIVFVAFGIFLYMPADIMPLAGEGTMQAISSCTGIAFQKVKIAFDVSMVVVSLVTCLICIRSMGSIGVGTIISVVCVGVVLGWVTKLFGKKRDRLLYGAEASKKEA